MCACLSLLLVLVVSMMVVIAGDGSRVLGVMLIVCIGHYW